MIQARLIPSLQIKLFIQLKSIHFTSEGSIGFELSFANGLHSSAMVDLTFENTFRAACNIA